MEEFRKSFYKQTVFNDTPLMSVVLSSFGDTLYFTITGGVAPYNYYFSVIESGSCIYSVINTPDGVTSSLTGSTTFSYNGAYSGSSYIFSVYIEDALGNSAFSNTLSFSGCLVYGTKIKTENSIIKNIEDVVVGDFILDKDSTYTEVLSTKDYLVDKVYIINNGLLSSSEGHIHIVKVNGYLIEKQANLLNIADILIDKDSNEVLINSIVVENNDTPVINISTKSKTYIANNILTHNKLSCPV